MTSPKSNRASARRRLVPRPPTHGDTAAGSERHMASDTHGAAQAQHSRRCAADETERAADHNFPTAARRTGDVDVTTTAGGIRENPHHDADHAAADRGHPTLPAASESNYRAPASRTVPARDCLGIELPAHDPVMHPEVARALLRLLLHAAEHDNTGTQHPPSPRSTP
jgi:hypothetical protein